MRIAACFLVIVVAGTTRAWALPSCPASHDVTLSGSVVGTDYGGTTQSYAITMNPCEAFWVDVSANLNGDPNGSANLYVDAFNASGTRIAFNFWYVTTSISQANAIPIADGGFPLTGSRDQDSLVTRIDVSSFGARTTYPMSFTLTVHFGARPGYNLGGLSYSDAFGPLANGTVLHASMWPAEVNYYRVSLLPNGTLTLSGTLVNKNYGLSLAIFIKIYSMAQQQLALILSQPVPANSSHDPNGISVSFTSSTFINTSSQSQDFYVVMENANGARLQDSTINVNGDLVPPPQLTLYLDATWSPGQPGHFNPLSPSSDDSKYVPGADLGTAASVPLPQNLQLIAAYLDASGHIVPPPSWAQSITFSLSNTSAFLGVAMNSIDQNTDPDYQLGACVQPAGTGCGFDGIDHTARVSLSCNDYGGFTTVSATDQVASPSFRLPRDDNGNWLPDVGWIAEGLAVADQGQAASDDSDAEPSVSAPPSTGLVGDGLTAFEEFRGFIVNGQHIRTNPSKKDYFVTYNRTWGIGFGTALPLAVHQIRGPDEFPGAAEFSANRVINANYTNSGAGGDIPGHFDQCGIRLHVDSTYIYGNFGHTNASVTDPYVVPNQVTDVVIYLVSHDDLADPVKWQTINAEPPGPYTRDQIDNEIRRTFGHELGHTVRMCHRDACALDDSQVGISLMNNRFYGGPPATDSRSKYNSFDIGQIRLINR